MESLEPDKGIRSSLRNVLDPFPKTYDSVKTKVTSIISN